MRKKVFEKLEEKLGSKVWRPLEEIQRPQPGNGAKRNLKRTQPIETQTRRIALHPGRDKVDKHPRVALVASCPVGAAECYEKLMPVQLPGDLLVARTLGLQLLKLAPMHEGRALPGVWFQVPVRFGSKREALKAK